MASDTPLRQIGETISWNGPSRVHSGEIVGFHKLGYIVRLENQKSVVVSESSIIPKE